MIDLDRQLELDPHVALRPEPFGALAYHYGNRRLVLLRHPDVLRVVQRLDGDVTVSEALRTCEVAEARWPAFADAIDSLVQSEVLRDRAHHD